MSKKSRAAKRAAGKVIRNGKPREERTGIAPPPALLPILSRPIWLEEFEVRLLIELMEIHESDHPLLGRLKALRNNLGDSAVKLKELEVTARANGFWMKEQGIVAEAVKKIKKGQRKRHSQAEEEIAALPAEEMKKLLEGGDG